MNFFFSKWRKITSQQRGEKIFFKILFNFLTHILTIYSTRSPPRTLSPLTIYYNYFFVVVTFNKFLHINLYSASKVMGSIEPVSRILYSPRTTATTPSAHPPTPGPTNFPLSNQKSYLFLIKYFEETFSFVPNTP